MRISENALSAFESDCVSRFYYYYDDIAPETLSRSTKDNFDLYCCFVVTAAPLPYLLSFFSTRLSGLVTL